MTTATLSIGKQLLEMKNSSLSDKNYLKRNAISRAKETGLFTKVINARITGILYLLEDGLKQIVTRKRQLDLVGDKIVIASTLEHDCQFIFLHTDEDISIISMFENIAREHDVDLSGQIEYLTDWMKDNEISISVHLVHSHNSWSNPYNQFLVKTL